MPAAAHQKHIQISGIFGIIFYQYKMILKGPDLFSAHILPDLTLHQGYDPALHPLWLVAENKEFGIRAFILNEPDSPLVIFLRTDPVIQFFIATGISPIHMKPYGITAFDP